jgi:hypothetical protein
LFEWGAFGMVLVEDVLDRSLTDRGMEDVGEDFSESEEGYLVSDVKVGSEGFDIDSELDRSGDVFWIGAKGSRMTVGTGDGVSLVFSDDGFYGWDVEFLTFAEDHSRELLEGVSAAPAVIRAAGDDGVWGFALDSRVSGVSCLASRFSTTFLSEGLILFGDIRAIRGGWFGTGSTIFFESLDFFVQDKDDLNQFFFGEILERLSVDDRGHSGKDFCLVVSV